MESLIYVKKFDGIYIILHIILHITVLNLLKTRPLYFEVISLLDEKLIFLSFLISETVI